MADEIQAALPAAPEAGRLVDNQVLLSSYMSSFNGARAFSGTADPMQVWSQMVRGGRDSIQLYREMELKDDTVADAMEEMKRSVLKRTITVVPLDESSDQAADIAGFIQQQFDAMPNWRNTLEAMLDAPFFGFSVAEQVFDVSSGQVALLDIRDCPQELFSFNPQMEPQTGPLRLFRTMGDYNGELVPENKFVVWTSRMRAGDRRGRALLREVYWSSWFNRNVLRFWLRLVERGPGTAVTSYTQGATPDEQRQALAAAEALISQVAMAVPESMVIREEFLKAARSQDPAAFAQLSDRMESKIIRRIVGSTLTSKGSDDGKGTQALGKVHENTKDERSVEYALQLEGALNRQVVQQLVLWNFGPDAPAVRVRLDKSDEEDLGARATVDDTILKWGLPISQNYAYSKYGIPAPKAGEDLLTAPVAPTLGSPAGAPDAPEFADALKPDADPTITRQVHREQKDFDKLFSQLRQASADSYLKRVRDLVSYVANEATE